MKINWLWRMAALWLICGLAHAGLPGIADTDDNIPTADQAFQVEAAALPTQQAIQVTFTLLKDVYLYRQRLHFRLTDSHGNLISDFADFELPHGDPKQDEVFGQVEVFHNFLEVDLPLKSVPLVDAELEVKYQGCLEDVLCYPPRTARFPLSFTAAAASPSAAATPAPASTQPAADDGADSFFATLSSEDANAFSHWMQGRSLGMIIALFFCGGLLLAFTPCVFPMIPILSGIIAGAGTPSAARGFSLSSAYVLGVAIPYTVAGMLVALFGAGLNLQFLLQQPLAIIVSALIFLILSLAMFGLYELQLPEFLRSRLNRVSEKQHGGSLAGAALMGAISGLIVSPCVTPILAGSLIYVASSGDMLTGALSMFFLALGMGVPLIIMGTGGGHLLPRAGGWMEDIKRFFGITMLIIAIWLLDRIIADALAMALYGFVIGGYGIYLGALEPVPSGGSRLKKTFALMLTLYGTLLVVGAAGGGTDPLQPLHHADADRAQVMPMQTAAGAPLAAGQWHKLRGSEALKAALAQAKQNGQPVLVDFFADWCTACKILEKETLTHPDVLQAMSHYMLIQTDITEINDDNQALMEQYGILGLPCLVFFDADGKEVQGKRILGEMGPQRFIQHLSTL